jgi:hypothetical protein
MTPRSRSGMGTRESRTHRTDCRLPYLLAEKVEEKVMDFWQKQKLAPELVEGIRKSALASLAEQRKENKTILTTQKRRLQKLESQRQKLIDAYLAEAIPVADLKSRQESVGAEQRDAQHLIELASTNLDLVERRLDSALELLEHCDRLYVGATNSVRREFNQAFFEALFVGVDGVQRAEFRPPFAQLRDFTIGLEDDDSDEPDNNSSTDRHEKSLQKEKNPSSRGTKGSNLMLLAEWEGFEPSRRVTPAYTISSRAP